MNLPFVKQSLKDLLPPVFILALTFTFQRLGDFATHIKYLGDGAYPPMLAWLLAIIPLPREISLFTISVIFVVFLPYVLIYEITGERKAAWAYLYGTGIVLVLGFVWLIPQAIIHVLMLAHIRLGWWFVPVFIIIGYFTHSAWFLGLALSSAYLLWRQASCQSKTTLAPLSNTASPA